MLTYDYDESDSDAARAAKLRVYEAYVAQEKQALESARAVADAQENLAAVRRAERG